MKMNAFDKNMAAASFAEANEAETAREFLDSRSSQRKLRVPEVKKGKPYFKTLAFGAVSISAYLLLFTNEAWVTGTFTKGGMYAALPVGAAFFFSFIHGAFASNLLSTLGLEAKK